MAKYEKNSKKAFLKKMEKIQKRELRDIRMKTIISNIKSANDLGQLKDATLGMFNK